MVKRVAAPLLLLISFLSIRDICLARQASQVSAVIDEQSLAAGIDAAASKAIQQQAIPGAVILAGHQGTVIFEKAYGNRSLEPSIEPMTLDTIFDVASLTKVVATTPAVMRLVEQGKIRLDDPVIKYLPSFGQRGKKKITIRQLLTHYSGLPADLPNKDLVYTDTRKPSARTILRKIYAIKPEAAPGERFMYSDLDFVLLGKIVEKVTGRGLDKYTHDLIFAPLKMSLTQYRPPSQLLNEIAPTEKKPWGEVLRGKVHDPTAYLLGGVAGHAGLFSTARDLARYCQMLLDGGTSGGVHLLSAETVHAMTSPQSPAGKKDVRGFGWDIQTPYSTLRGSRFSAQSYGHTGYTGTSLWIDPSSQTYVIILSNRVHPLDRGNLKELRVTVSDLVGAAVVGNAE